MINPTTLQTGLAGLVGFRNSVDTAMPQLSASLLVSDSGIYINDQHALITIENINATIENTGTITLPAAWSALTTYAIGDKVTSSGIIYTAKLAGINHAVTDATYWTLNGNPISIYLGQKLNQAMANIASRIFLEKNLNENSKSILPETMLYDNGGNIRKIIQKAGRFVGFKLSLKSGDLGMIIRKIGMQFSDVQTGLNIYLYNSSQATAVKIWSVTTTKMYSFEWEDLTKQVMSFLSDTTNAGSSFMIGYYEDDIVGNAINNEYSFITNFCGPCNPVNWSLRQKWSKYVSIQPFFVTAANINADKTIWNSEHENLTDNINFGLNILTSVFCDSTDFFVRNKDGLVKALALQTAVSIIEDMGFSGRDNQKMLKVQQMANYALNMKENNQPGLYKDLENEIKAVRFNYSNTNSECLPCDSLYNNSVNIKSVY